MQWQCHIVWIDDANILTPIITQQLALNKEFNIHICSSKQLNLEYLQQAKANLILANSDAITEDINALNYPIIALGQASADYQNIIQTITPPLRLLDLAQIIQQSFIKNSITINDWLLNPKTLELSNASKSIQLTDKESAILSILYYAAPEQVSKNTLLQTIWNYHVEIETHTLETHIYKLRQKIEQDAKKPVMILTEGDGYRLNI